MREDMRRNYDYTLIDSRTGLSDIAGICTVRFPDTVVNCFTLSGQSIDGAAAVARTIGELDESRDIQILPVPMRVEDGEQAKLEAGRALARSKFTGFPRGLGPEATVRYWGEVEVPYKPFYAYEETLATFGDEPHLRSSLLAAFERLTGVITDGRICELPPMPEERRKRFAALYERRKPFNHRMCSSVTPRRTVPGPTGWPTSCNGPGFRWWPRGRLRAGGQRPVRGASSGGGGRVHRGAALRRVLALLAVEDGLGDAGGGGVRPHG